MPVLQSARRASVAAVVATLVLGAAGCGQKGALYLPDRGGEVVTRPTQTPAEGSTPAPPQAPGDEPSPGTAAPKPPSQPPR